MLEDVCVCKKQRISALGSEHWAVTAQSIQSIGTRIRVHTSATAAAFLCELSAEQVRALCEASAHLRVRN